MEQWQIDGFLPFMRDVTRCDDALRELNQTWRAIESSARLHCAQEARGVLPMLSATREGFERLEQELVDSLVTERVQTALQSVGIRARHVVDIVVRNLYERTADVGFLATDGDLCDYLAGRRLDRDQATARLRAYRDKYTVYDDILLLDPQGTVMAQIDTAAPVLHSTDPLVQQALASDGYVERFGPTDLRPGQRHALLYARRMHDASGRVVGVLCLSFHFDNEMTGIFRSRRDREERAVMLLLDAADTVIASSDALWLPVGTVVPTNPDCDARLVVFSGREYLLQTHRPQAYQGYAGPPGWQGQVMIPVDIAFNGRRQGALDQLAPAMAQGLLTHAQRFCPPLFEIVGAAQAIRRVVWNGQVMTGGQDAGLDLRKLKTMLEQVSDAGVRTDDLFTHAIHDLYDTVLGAAMRRAEFATRLQVDLLDRNLYERSDDCRWWALNPVLRSVLGAADGRDGGSDAAALAALGGTLETIHALYTVYTRLVVYDRSGRIVAATQAEQPDGSSVVGTLVDADILAAVLALPGPQAYHVSPFRPTPLYGGRPTYVYHAAIRHPQDERQVVGGIGIVFDAEPEFRAMLREGLQGHAAQDTALFVCRGGQVLSSADALHPVGSRVDVPADLLADLLTLPRGASASRVVEHHGQYAVLACSVSSGYREFKVSDGYSEDVLALMFEPLGAVVPACALHPAERQQAQMASLDTQHGLQFATFFLDGQLHALPAGNVYEALPAAQIAPVSAGRAPHRLGMISARCDGQAPRHIWVYDLLGLLRQQPTTDLAQMQVIVAHAGGQAFGLLVSSLHAVPEFAPAQVCALQMRTPAGNLVSHMIRTESGDALIPVLDAAAIARHLHAADGGSGPVQPAQPVDAAALDALPG